MERQVPEGIQVNLSIRRASFIVHSNSSSEVLGIFIPYKLQCDFNVDFKSFLKCYLKRQKEEYAWIRKLSTGWVSSTACLASCTFSHKVYDNAERAGPDRPLLQIQDACLQKWTNRPRVIALHFLFSLTGKLEIPELPLWFVSAASDVNYRTSKLPLPSHQVFIQHCYHL